MATRSLKVFLSHSSGDAAAVRALHTRLRASGIDSWLDSDEIVGGQDWEFEIRKAIRASDAIVICLTRASVAKSGFVQREIRFALAVAEEQPEGSIFIIPVRLEECDVPQSLERWHRVDHFREDGGDRLLQALRRRARDLGLTSLDAPPAITQPRASRFEGIASRLEAEASTEHAALVTEAERFSEDLTDLCRNITQTQRVINGDPAKALPHIDDLKRQVESLRQGLREFEPQAKRLRDGGVRRSVWWTQLTNAERGIAELDVWTQRLSDIPATLARLRDELGLGEPTFKTWIYLDEHSRRVLVDDPPGKGASFVLASNGRIKDKKRL